MNPFYGFSSCRSLESAHEPLGVASRLCIVVFLGSVGMRLKSRFKRALEKSCENGEVLRKLELWKLEQTREKSRNKVKRSCGLWAWSLLSKRGLISGSYRL